MAKKKIKIKQIQNQEKIENIVKLLASNNSGTSLDDGRDSGIFKELLGKFEQAVEEFWDITHSKKQLEGIILDPEQIDAFLQRTTSYKQQDNYTFIVDLFITPLIQNSYCAGYNNFYLSTESSGKINVGFCLTGDSENHIKLRISGDVQNFTAIKSRYLELNIDGNSGNNLGQGAYESIMTVSGNCGHSCGLRVINSVFSIYGDVGPGCGPESMSSIFNIKGNAEECCGYYSKASVFSVDGRIKEMVGDGSKNSTFRTTNPQNLSELLFSVSPGNKIIYVQPDGTEMIWKKISKYKKG